MKDESAKAKKPTKKEVIAARIAARAESLAIHAPKFVPGMSIVCGDALDLLSFLPDGSMDAIITDPPYGVDMAAWDADVPEADIWREAFRALTPGAFCVVAAAPRTVHRTAAALEAAGFEIRDQIVWNYTQSFPGAQEVEGEWRSNLKTNQEPWVVAQKPLEKGLSLRENWGVHGVGAVRTGATGAGGWQTNVIKCPKPNAADRNLGTVPGKVYGTPSSAKTGVWSNSQAQANNHPTAKPLALCRRLVSIFVPEKSNVCDPFMGSGSILMAAAAEGHGVHGSDLEPSYCELAQDRIDWAYANSRLFPPAA